MPRKVFEQNYGTDVINSQAMEDVVPEVYTRAIREHDLDPVERPHMELLPHEDGKPMRVKATVTVRPEIELGTYRGVEVAGEAVVVVEEDVERSLRALARDRATLVPVSRPAQLGDFVVMDFEGSIDGQVFEGGSATGQTVELSADRFIPGFATGIAGMSAGDTREVHATFPEGYEKAELAGKAATFRVAVHDVKEAELPTIDDAFAKNVSSNETLEELRADIRRRLEAVAQNKTRKQLGNAIMEKLLETHDFPLPDVMVEREVDNLVMDARTFASRMGMTWDAYLSAAGKTEEALRAELHADAERRVKGTLLVEAIAKREQINATPADVQTELASLADQYGQPVDRIRQALGNNVLSLMDGIVRSKTMDWLIEQAQVKQATESAKS